MPKITITKAEITQVFAAWDKETKETPDAFEILENALPEEQAEQFLSYLAEFRSQFNEDRNK